MTRPDPPPPEIVDLARERSAARAARDWPRADALRAEIEAAGWKVVDAGTDFRLEPAAPPTVEDGEIVRYGAAATVPSVLDEPPSARFTVELVAEDWPDDLARMLAGLRAHAPAGTQVVIVADAPSAEQEARLSPGSPDLAPVAGAVARGGLDERAPRPRRRAATSGCAGRPAPSSSCSTPIEPTGDSSRRSRRSSTTRRSPSPAASGLVSDDLRRFEDAAGATSTRSRATGSPSAATTSPRWDRSTSGSASTATSTSGGASSSATAPTRTRPGRRARLDLPLVRHEHRGWTSLPEGRARSPRKRNFYRVLDRFRDRPDLLSGAPAGEPSTAAVSGPGGRPPG